MSPLLSLLLSLVLSDSPKSSPRPRHHREARRRFAPRRPRLEVLEDRALPSAYIVTTTADTGPGSLREAINQVNADTGHALYASPSNPSVDEIDFNITAGSDTGGGFNAGTGVATMTPHSALPTITNAVLIDGYTQAGASGNSNPFGHADNPVLKIELDGAGVANGNGLGLMAPNITVCGLVINRFTGGAGIALYLAPGAWVYGNYIGVDPTGEIGEDNGGGVAVTFSDHVTVGANGDGVNDLIERNLISGAPGYGGDGIYITGSNNVTIQGNYLGTDAIGNVAIANQGDDIRAQYTNSQLRIIGNVISGDGVAMGITLVNTTSLSGVVIQGNRIGTNAAGTAALGDQFGIELEGNIQDVHIGGTDTNTPGAPLAGAGNLISGNYNGLVSLDSANVTIQGNYVGTDVTGSYAIPNVNRGMVVGHAGSQNITIGGVTAGTGNLVSGNALAGINIVETAGPVLIEGNTVGTDATGTYAIGNTYGIEVGAASGVTIGGATQAARNLVSGNGGIGIVAGGTGDLIEGNFIGTDPSGTRAVPNGNGLYGAGGLALGTNSTAIGNLVSGNNGFGVSPGGTGDVVQGNKIGTDVTGNFALANQGPGVNLSSGQYNLIGGPGSGQGNLISGNTGDGIDIGYSVDSYHNTVQGNRIGTNAAGTAALGNGGDGVLMYQNHDNSIGGSGPGEGNIISGNHGDGVGIGVLSATGNVVQGNRIGTDATGTLHLGNTGAGVSVFFNANNEAIGGVAAGQGNTIAYNGSAGVVVHQGSAITILGNSIHDNGGLGIELDGGANNDQAAPVLTSTLSGLGITVVTGTITSVPNATVRVEFFANALGDPEGATLLGTQSVATDSSGHGSFTVALSAPLPAGQGLVTATVTDPSGNTSEFSAGITATPLPPSSLSGVVWEDFNNDGQVDFGETGISGVTITLTGTDFLGHAVNLSQTTDGDGAYVFLNLLPGNYTLTETQPAGYPQGIDSVGTAGGSLSGTDQFFVALGLGVNGLNYNFGEQPPAGSGVKHGQTAGIGFWNNKNGQALILALNGGGASTQLANWLADTLPNTFGKKAGANNLTGKSNAYVAALFQQDFVMKGVKLDAQLLATALSVYATNATLDPTKVAASYGFTVSGDGAGTATFNVGSNGDAFGVANNTTMTVMDLLLATDAQAVNGVLYNGNAAKRNEANTVFSAVNQAGDIS